MSGGSAAARSGKREETLRDVVCVLVFLLPRHLTTKLEGVVSFDPGNHIAYHLVLVDDVEALERVDIGDRARKRDLRNHPGVVFRENLWNVDAGKVRLAAASDNLRADQV